jgi:hypothetical protein
MWRKRAYNIIILKPSITDTLFHLGNAAYLTISTVFPSHTVAVSTVILQNYYIWGYQELLVLNVILNAIITCVKTGISRHYQIFWEAVGLERGPLSLVSTTEELLESKSNGSGLESREYGRRDPSIWPCGTLYQQKLALTLPTSGGHSLPDSGHGVFYCKKPVDKLLMILYSPGNAGKFVPDGSRGYMIQ